ncbi:MAG: DEAD/DEAH box helicase [Planctomycetes bacterium]|nr:DEAD/DEAH box helicase [Planctomycetota bacterium]
MTGFHPTIQRWFDQRFDGPTPPQARGWPLIQQRRNVLIAAPTGSGKTLAAFLAGIDALLREPELPASTRILYISPLKALSNDVQKNLEQPLEQLRALDPALPEVRVLVRTGDTRASQRAAMSKRHPHILVTTPESVYILLTTAGGRAMLSGVRTVIVDEIHALAKDKRGSHLALSLERLDALVAAQGGALQRLGLSATQRPMDLVARFLVGVGRDCEVVDEGHRRALDLGIVVPESPLTAVCSTEQWDEVYGHMADLIRAHRTTLVFVNTRKLAERIGSRLGTVLNPADGPPLVASHHGSLSRELRLEAERRLKQGELRALVATASLELGIDVGDVDLVIQVGSVRSIATFLQRVGRSGHALGKTPKGRLFPLTRDELVEAAAVLRAVRRGDLDRLEVPARPLDILIQQVVAACVVEPWDAEALLALCRRAWPFRDLTREDFDRAWSVHTHHGLERDAGGDGEDGGAGRAARGRLALLHHDPATGRLRATKRARIVAVTSGGAIPDAADYQVRVEPEETLIGTINEDFAVESNVGDVFQLGNASWRVLKVEPGVVRVASADGAPPTIPFWLGEAPARTRELSKELSDLREAVVAESREGGPEQAAAWLEREAGLAPDGGRQVVEYLDDAARSLGTIPTQDRLVLERFFDESGGMQLVLHAPFGGRINRALGLALRKKFCVGFGFELQAAANEEAIILSLGPQHSFPLPDVFDYVRSATAIDVLTQALLAAPMFATRWRWNATRALLVERMRNGKRLPAPLVRMRSDDLLVASFPQVLACPETLPPGPVDVPLDHPIVFQTVEDCLTEAMDREGFLGVLRRLEAGEVERVAVDTPEPSALAQGVLAAQPYAFLDDAPLEERRTQAVLQRRGRDRRTQDGLGALDPGAIARVREEAWPQPQGPEEVHEALSWMGFVASREAPGWLPWLRALEAQGRVERVRGPGDVGQDGGQDDDRWLIAGGSRDPLDLLRGRMEALGPVVPAPGDEPLLLRLEQEGSVLRVRFDGRDGWCDRRLLARIQRYTVERLRREIEPVSAAQLWRFLGVWQHAAPDARLEGPRGVAAVLEQLAGFEAPAAEWERSILPARVRGYRRDWLDALTLTGELAWGRLWGGGAAAAFRTTPLCFVPRGELSGWLALAGAASDDPDLPGPVRALVELLERRGAMFQEDLARELGLLPEPLERALGEAVGRGLVTCDSFAAARGLIVPPSRRHGRAGSVGRWSLFRRLPRPDDGASPTGDDPGRAERVARALLRRYGVVFKRLLAREQAPVPWRDLVRVFRLLELRGEVRGGRFVGGFSGEQYALPEAVTRLRDVRRKDAQGAEALGASPAGPGDAPDRPGGAPLAVSAADPLNLAGILTPDERVARTARRRVLVG